MSDENAAAFVEVLDVAVQAKHTYAKQLAAIFSRAGLPDQMLRTLMSALAAAGALRPVRQATPMTPAQLDAALEIFPLSERDALRMAWTTAARWDDIIKFRLANVVQEAPEHITLHFCDTKATRSSPFRPQDLVVITGRHLPAVRRLITRVRHKAAANNNNNANEPFTTLSTKAVDKLLKPLGLSAHSVKRGALTTIMRQAAANNLPPYIIGVMARHAKTAPIPESVARYLSDATARAEMALFIGTAAATRLL